MTARFSIQKHVASHLHWDLRLEREGILKSWAIPKEPPNIKGVRRLAIEVEDHSFSFIDFEGNIPEGEYGAGTISIWDSGSYELLSEDDSGMKLLLSGKRLFGEYTLHRLVGTKWLFFKN